MQKKINKVKTYIWAELIAGRSVTEASVYNAIGSRKGCERIHDLRRDLERSNAPYEIVTVMQKASDGARYARWHLEHIEPAEQL